MKQDKSGSLAWAGLAAGGAVAAAASADAAVVYTVVQTEGSQIVTDSPTTPAENYNFDVNTDGEVDVSVSSNYNKSKPDPLSPKSKVYTYSGDVISGSTTTGIGGEYAAGTQIGTVDTFSDGASTFVAYDGSGNPGPYIALRFGTPGAYNYGYIQLREGTSPNAFDQVAYAYETTPNTPITAGATPEPAALAGLAVGAAALLKRRGKRD